ncbi:MAG: dual specificity protein phosphatase family protein [Desulfurococcaceae archaeon]
MYTWIIEGKLAQAPLPSRSTFKQLMEAFTGIIVLPTWRELPVLYIDHLKEAGLDVLHIPTPDNYPVELLDVLRASLFIEKHVSRGGAVLVHCYGGIGRSGQVTAGYLIYKGYGVYEALLHVRSKVPGSVENQWQLQLLEDYYMLTSSVDRLLLSRFVEVVEELSETDGVSYKHLSKVLQFTIELYNGLGLNNVDVRRELYASMLHAHRDNVIKLLKEKTGLAMESSEGLVDFSHSLDYKMDSKVVVLHTRTLDKPEITLLCSEPCEDTVNVAEGNSAKLTALLGVKPVLSWGIYSDYI